MISNVLKSTLLTPAGRKVAEAVCLDKHVGIERLFNLLGEMQEQLQQLRDNSGVIPEDLPEDDDDDDHPSLTAAERNPNLK